MTATETRPATETASDIATTNVTMAVDQVGSYSGLTEALDVYGQNASDTAREHGISTADLAAAWEAALTKALGKRKAARYLDLKNID